MSLLPTLRICIGEEPQQWLAREVLRSSILRRTKCPVDFIEISKITQPKELNPLGRPSFLKARRFLLPEFLKFEGKVIYLDGSALVLCDLLELWEGAFHEKGALAKRVRPLDLLSSEMQQEVSENEIGFGERYTGVMFLNNEKLAHWNWVTMKEALLKQDQRQFRAMLWNFPNSPFRNDFADLNEGFCETEKVKSGTKIFDFLHARQHPMRDAAHPETSLFLQELKAALEAGDLDITHVIQEALLGNIRKDLPGLLA